MLTSPHQEFLYKEGRVNKKETNDSEKYAPETEIKCTFQKTNSMKCFLLVFIKELKVQ
jgi:hypothetical protein